MRCALKLKWHQNAAHRVEFISPQTLRHFSRHFQGAFLGWRIPRVETPTPQGLCRGQHSDMPGRKTRARRSRAKESWADIVPLSGENARSFP
jgi:hypothetical protein